MQRYIAICIILRLPSSLLSLIHNHFHLLLTNLCFPLIFFHFLIFQINVTKFFLYSFSSRMLESNNWKKKITKKFHN